MALSAFVIVGNPVGTVIAIRLLESDETTRDQI
jgi:hypothetical protein